MLLLVMLVAGATSTGPTAVVVTRRMGVSPADSAALAELATRALTQAGFDPVLEPAEASRQLAALGVKDTAACLARQQCVLEFGRQLGAGLIVSVALSEFEAEGSMTLEAWSVAREKLVLAETILFKARGAPADELAAFAQRLKEKVAPGPDTPVNTTLVPTPPGPVLPLPAPAGRSHTPAVVLGGVGAAALVAAGVLGVTGLLAKQRLDTTVSGAPNRSPLSESEARAIATSANTQFTAATIAGLAGAGLGATAIILW